MENLTSVQKEEVNKIIENRRKVYNSFNPENLTIDVRNQMIQDVKTIYREVGLSEPKVVFVKSPEEAKKIVKVEPYPVGYKNNDWLSFYDIFINTNVEVSPKLREKHAVVTRLVNNGCYAMVTYDELCVIVLGYVDINLDEEGRLHSTTKEAVLFSDGYGQHYVHGRYCEPKIFNDMDSIENAKIRFFNETNEDVKSVICFIIRDRFGNEGLLKMLDATLYKEETVKHSETYTETLRLYRTNSSYSFLANSKGDTNQPYCWLEYTCPSTNTIYLIDTFADFKTPIEAAKFHRPANIPFEVPYNWEWFAN